MRLSTRVIDDGGGQKTSLRREKGGWRRTIAYRRSDRQRSKTKMMTPIRITLLLALVLCAPFLMAHRQPQTPSARPVAEWTFDEGTGNTVAGKGADGTLKGNTSWTEGLVGAHALRLPGRPGSFVDVSSPVIDTTHSYTITACVKLNRIGGYLTFVSIDGDRI